MTQEQSNQNLQSSGNYGSKIPGDEALRIIQEYENEPGGPGKTKSVWSDLQFVQELCQFLQEHANDGIRVDYGKYPPQGYEQVPFPEGPQNFNGRHTLVIVPTYVAADGSSGTMTDRQQPLRKAVP